MSIEKPGSKSSVIVTDQCCGTRSGIRCFFTPGIGIQDEFFPDLHLDSDPHSSKRLDPDTNILTRNFLKWCLSWLFWNLNVRENCFSTEKHTCFSLSSV
jgi:hypothetical protein